MKMTLKMLLYFLRDLQPEVFCRAAGECSFAGAKQFFAGMERDEDGEYLYVASLSDVLAHGREFPENTAILAVSDCDLSMSAVDVEKSGVNGNIQQIPVESYLSYAGTLILVKGCGVPWLMNRVIEIFRRLTDWDKTMHILALEGKSVQELVDHSELLLERPTIIFDASFDVIAYTKNITSDYGNFQTTVRNGYTDANVMAQVRQKKIFQRLEKGKLLVAPEAADETHTNVYLSFFSGNTLLGYACVFHGETQPDEGYLDLLRLFMENINFCLKRDYENRRFGDMMSETFLLNLMNPSGISGERIAEQVKNIEGVSLHGRFVLGVVAFADAEHVPLAFAARLLDWEMEDVKPFIYENQICLLRILDENGIAGEFFRDWERENVGRILENYSFSLGISNVFYEVTDLRYAYLQAVAALQFGKEGERITLYEDICYCHLFSLLERELPVSRLCWEVYGQIKKYDKEHKTDYCRILMAYLENDCNATHTAAQLFLHRNTVRNAVQFVGEHWGIAITDTEVKKKLVLSELAEQYANRTQRT